jgi:hypothetical protein
MEGNLFRSTIKSRKYNKMGERMVIMMRMPRCDDGDDAQASNDPSGDDNRCPSTSSAFRSLLEVIFLRVLVSMNVES